MAIIIFYLFLPTVSTALTSYERVEIEKLVHWLPFASCQPHRPLRSCILWTSDSCELAMEQALQRCIESHSYSMSRPSGSLAEWKARMIACADGDVRALMQPQLRNTIECQNKFGRAGREPSSAGNVNQCRPYSIFELLFKL